MSRKTLIPAEAIDTSSAINLIADGANNATAIAQFSSKQNAEVAALAAQLGYDGDLSIDTLEYEIGQYQRRAVDACLALGALLILLKKQAGHGNFESRIAAHGISYSAANRFMNAAQKTGKNPTLGLLSTTVKSFSAFSELIFEDDDTLKAISELDNIDRMPASELRRLVRDMKGTQAKDEKLISNQTKLIRKLERQAEEYTADEVEQHLRKALSDAELQATATLDGDLRVAIEKIMLHGEEHGKSYTELLAGHLLQIEASCQALREQFGINRALDDVPAWMTNTAGTAAN